MGRDHRKLYLIDTVKLFPDMLKILLPMEGNHRHTVLIQIQEPRFSIHHRFYLRFRTVLQDLCKALLHIIRHRHKPCPAVGLRVYDSILHIPSTLQLMIYIDNTIFNIYIRNSQTDKLRNTQACMEQDVDPFVVPAKMPVVFNKLKELSFLFSRDCFPCYGVIHYNGSKLELEGIFTNQVIIHGHLKCRSYHTSDRMDGAVSATVLLQLDKSQPRVGQFHLVNPPAPELFFFEDIDHKLIADTGILPDPCFLCDIFLYKFQYGHISAR